MQRLVIWNVDVDILGCFYFLRFHLECMGLDERIIEGIEDWYCPRCDENHNANRSGIFSFFKYLSSMEFIYLLR